MYISTQVNVPGCRARDQNVILTEEVAAVLNCPVLNLNVFANPTGIPRDRVGVKMNLPFCQLRSVVLLYRVIIRIF